MNMIKMIKNLFKSKKGNLHFFTGTNGKNYVCFKYSNSNKIEKSSIVEITDAFIDSQLKN